jgi:hypothetical protein
LESISNQSTFDNDQSKRKNYAEWHLFDEKIGDFGLGITKTNFDLESINNNIKFSKGKFDHIIV